MITHDLNNLPASPEGREWRETSDSATLSAKTRVHIRTLDELLAFFEVDKEMWEVSHWTCNQWEQGQKDSGTIPLHQIKATFVRRKKFQSEKEDILSFIADTKKSFAKSLPKLPAPKRNKKKEHLLVPSISDPHFGKLAWGEETGWENYDLKTAEAVVIEAAQSLLNKAMAYTDSTGRILFPVGNDLLHVDTGDNKTTNGTPQDCDGRAFKAYKLARQTMMRVIRMYREIAPVSVLIVPGNHDHDRVFHLGDALDMAFDGDKHVEILNAPTRRKYFRWGKTLMGADHGIMKPQRLRELMQLERREDWGQTSFAEWFVGHLHKKQELTSAVDEEAGVRIRRIPSLTPPDAWHSASGYVGTPRSAEMLVYHDETGYDAQFNFTLR